MVLCWCYWRRGAVTQCLVEVAAQHGRYVVITKSSPLPGIILLAVERSDSDYGFYYGILHAKARIYKTDICIRARLPFVLSNLAPALRKCAWICLVQERDISERRSGSTIHAKSYCALTASPLKRPLISVCIEKTYPVCPSRRKEALLASCNFKL